MSPDVARCHQMSPDVARCRQMSPDVAKCRQMSPCRQLSTLGDSDGYIMPLKPTALAFCMISVLRRHMEGWGAMDMRRELKLTGMPAIFVKERYKLLKGIRVST